MSPTWAPDVLIWVTVWGVPLVLGLVFGGVGARPFRSQAASFPPVDTVAADTTKFDAVPGDRRGHALVARGQHQKAWGDVPSLPHDNDALPSVRDVTP
jgi:hypothetical protein